MPSQNPQPKRHHYVPRMVLKRFAHERKTGRLYTNVFDKWEDKTFAPAIENIMVEGAFNTLQVGASKIELEEPHTRVENLAEPVISRIVHERSLDGLSPDERGALCIFAALQFLRSPERRAQFSDLADEVQKRVMALGSDPGDSALATGPDDAKRSALRMIVKDLGTFAQHFADKDMVLIAAARGEEFLIGDSPVVLHNDEDFGPYGNLGIGVPGIQISLPLSPELALGFWCPSIRGRVRDTIERTKQTSALATGWAVLRSDVADAVRQGAEALAGPLQRLSAFLDDSSGSKPMQASSQNMEHWNSLQVMTAERFVISRMNEFAFARRILFENPQLKRGRRMQFN